MQFKTLQVRVKDKHAARIEAKRFCLYAHSFEEEIFYIGVGVSTRPFERIKRNAKWDDFVAGKAYFDVAILQWSDDRNELLRAEAALIAEVTPACNLLMNGYTNELRRLRTSEVMTGKVVSNETRALMSAASKARGNGWDGKTHSTETREKIRAAQASYPIRCIESGLEFPSIRDASIQLAISKTSLRSHLSGRSPHVRGMTFEKINICRRGLASLAEGAVS